MFSHRPQTEQLQALQRLGELLRMHQYRFTAITPLTHGTVNARATNAEARNLMDVFGWNRPFHQSLLDPDLFTLMQTADILIREETQHWRSAVRWSTLHDRLYLHSGFPTAQTDAVYFGPDTYRFVRAIDSFLQSRAFMPPQRMVEIGCGAGAAAIDLAIALPDTEVAAVDINSRALQFTQLNAAVAGVENLRVYHSNLLQGVDGNFDLIIANPPYMIDSEHRVYRDGGGDLGSGLSVAIITAALPRLTLGGSLLLYTGAAITAAGDPFFAHAERILSRSPAFTWSYVELDPDVYGEELLKPGYEQVERIAVVLLTVTRHS